MRFATGVGGSDLIAWQPKRGMPVPGGPGPQTWVCGHALQEVRRARAAGQDGEVLALGCCLATGRELDAAAARAADGWWQDATRLAGSYLTLVRTGTVWRIAGDRAGAVTVYWARHDGQVLWSTAAAPLAAYAGADPDPAVLLAAFTVRGVDPYATSSPFNGIHRVPPGHTLVLEPGRTSRIEAVPPPVSRLSFEAGAEGLRHTLGTAVSRRVASVDKVSCDLSGGVDSSTITSLAAGQGPLLAVTYTDARMGQQDDALYAARVAADFPQMLHAVVDGTAEGVQHFASLDAPGAVPLTDTPSFTLGLLAIKAAQLAPATAYGSRLHLTGRGGDDVLDAVPTMPVDMFRAGHRRSAAARLVYWARVRRTGAWPVLRAAARTAWTTYPSALSVLAERITHTQPSTRGGRVRTPEALAWCGLTNGAPWLTGHGRDLVAALVGERAKAADPDASPGAVHERLALELMGDGHNTYDQIARALWDLPIHAPLLDTAVVDVCQAVPGWERARPGEFKPLAKAAFAGKVPGYLLERRTKTSFTGSTYVGLRANAAAVRRILAGSRLAQAGLIDGHAAIAALDGAARGEPSPLFALHALVATELWLAAMNTRRSLWWEPETVRAQAAS